MYKKEFDLKQGLVLLWCRLHCTVSPARNNCHCAIAVVLYLSRAAEPGGGGELWKRPQFLIFARGRFAASHASPHISVPPPLVVVPPPTQKKKNYSHPRPTYIYMYITFSISV